MRNLINYVKQNIEQINNKNIKEEQLERKSKLSDEWEFFENNFEKKT